MHHLGVALKEATNGQLAGEREYRVVGPAQVVEREGPVNRVFQRGQRHALGGVGHARQPQVAAVRHEASEEHALSGPGRPITWTPVREAVREVALLIDGM